MGTSAPSPSSRVSVRELHRAVLEAGWPELRESLLHRTKLWIGWLWKDQQLGKTLLVLFAPVLLAGALLGLLVGPTGVGLLAAFVALVGGSLLIVRASQAAEAATPTVDSSAAVEAASKLGTVTGLGTDGRCFVSLSQAERARRRANPHEQTRFDPQTGEWVRYHDARPWWQRCDDAKARDAIAFARAARTGPAHRGAMLPRRTPGRSTGRPSDARPARGSADVLLEGRPARRFRGRRRSPTGPLRPALSAS
jgi:hypothetical protein